MERETLFKRLDRGIQKHIVQVYTVIATDLFAASVAFERIIEGENSEAKAVLTMPFILNFVAGYHFYCEGVPEKGK
ncbi:hypothetical protein A3D07_04045 [Candidatus Curtissbacteria bacterium RIFCSPHIGHO2_02_FULL_42_15]|uniref:Uncharacterized protein n=1 Tax=Candidatus Curtissbacteria bacterium RIFCSPHIGHO2_02_FULL_42_15 TaxID=1797716 RepID=A0A1F5GDF5_9BACT|nr:MAG: hypothetical protein A3D07_04045 [Candidatus Curtissbacteria bacterium RIFCSPHIGHO2_02_FULL_42_15]